MEIRKFGQFLLGETPFEPELAHPLTKDDSRIGISHAAIIKSLTTMSLHTISVIRSSAGRVEALTPRPAYERASMMHLSIVGGIVAFALWCVTDTSLKPDHVRNSDGRITSWGILSIVLVQIVLWTLVGFFAAWIVPHLPRFLLTRWRLPLTVFGSSILQWFALLMILQYVWTITRATLSTVVVALLARLGSQWAKRALDDGHRQRQFMERRVGVGQKQSSEGVGK